MIQNYVSIINRRPRNGFLLIEILLIFAPDKSKIRSLTLLRNAAQPRSLKNYARSLSALLSQVCAAARLRSRRKITNEILVPRKEVIQPHLPVRLPCYDFTPVTNPALGRCSLTVSSRTSGVVDFHGVTGGVYKTRERIQRSVLICVY